MLHLMFEMRLIYPRRKCCFSISINIITLLPFGGEGEESGTLSAYVASDLCDHDETIKYNVFLILPINMTFSSSTTKRIFSLNFEDH